MFNYMHVHLLSFHLLQVLFILPVFVCSPILEEIKYLSIVYCNPLPIYLLIYNRLSAVGLDSEKRIVSEKMRKDAKRA